MIIDFTIQNFRSIKDEALLSMHVESPRNHLSTHVAYPAGDRIGVLRSTGIYGANASGKTNILFAFQALQNLVVYSGDLKEGEPIPWYDPYRLSDATKKAPVQFELEFFSHDNIRYLYSVSFTHTSIIEESLDFFPTRQKANIFKRTENDSWETIQFGGHYKGGVRRIPIFKNNSYLSKAANSAAAADVIRAAYDFFRKGIAILGPNQKILMSDMEEYEKSIDFTSKLLCLLDTEVARIKIHKNENLSPVFIPDNLPEKVKKVLIERSKLKFFFAHENESGDLEEFEEDRESDGTQRLFSFLPVLKDILKSGGIIFMDELENSFHPHIAELIIKLFNDSEVNIKNAQLIFTTHNINLMNPARMRRDQIWFTEKNRGKTQLYSLDSFDKKEVKSNSPFDDWYDNGRFGAVPSIDYMSISKLLRPAKDEKLTKDNKNRKFFE